MAKNRKHIIGVVIAIVVVMGSYFTYEHFTYVKTDNAQVGAHVTLLSSKVNGTIVQVFVKENQMVKAGEVLAQIDTSDLSNASEAASAQVASLEARMKEAEIGYKRSQALIHSRAVTQEQFDNALATYRETEAKLKAARAQQDQAKLNVGYTKILAPVDGIIARKSLETGQFVAVGQPLFGFVGTNERWITANLKETELTLIKIGAPAEISIDALPKEAFSGEVESIGPSTGAIFSLLPPDNATGNFTKVVQRVPVRIKIKDLKDEQAERLRAGLSADVAIRIR